MNQKQTVTVENLTEHPYEFVVGDVSVTVPRCGAEQPNPNLPARRVPGSAQVPRAILVRLLKDRSVRSWFDDGHCRIPAGAGATFDELLSEQIPVTASAASATSAVDSQVGQARKAIEDNKRLVDDNEALKARIAELEAKAKGKGDK